jgi:hypothetical protein
MTHTILRLPAVKASTGLSRSTIYLRVSEGTFPNCEQYCFMPVHVLPAEGNQPARAFISCDKRDDIGRGPAEMRRLAQWKITGGLLAKTLARLLGFLQVPQEDGAGKGWTLGMLKGNEHKAQIALAVANGVALKVAGHDIPLVRRGATQAAALRLASICHCSHSWISASSQPTARPPRLTGQRNGKRY